jgi:hypothetical protein
MAIPTCYLAKAIIDHKSEDGTAVRKDDGFETTNDGGWRRNQCTTRGWKLLVTWKDGSTSWVPLKDLKESFPVQAGGGIHHGKQDRRGTCFCLMGKACAAQT